jgi:hypothetical protein
MGHLHKRSRRPIGSVPHGRDDGAAIAIGQMRTRGETCCYDPNDTSRRTCCKQCEVDYVATLHDASVSAAIGGAHS